MDRDKEQKAELQDKALEFRLTYRGLLPATDKCVPIKHAIRMRFGRQLRELWKRERLLSDMDFTTFAEVPVRNRSVEVPQSFPGHGFYIVVGGVKYVPIVHRWLSRVAEVQIDLYRRDEPGEIFRAGGDLDNRLKTLMDALRIPHHESETPNNAQDLPEDGFCVCVLEDDSLITKVGVSTHRLLDLPTENERPESVEVVVHVIVKATIPCLGNQGWLPA